jgi:hypothetical protein
VDGVRINIVRMMLSLAIALADRRINNLQQDFQSLIWYWYDSVPCSARFSSGSEP